MSTHGRPPQELTATRSYDATLPGAVPASWMWQPEPLPVPHSATLPIIEEALEHQPPRMVPPQGKRFVEVAPLGRGAMGEVVLVQDRDLDRNVAVKRMLPGAQHAGAVQAFVREVRTLGTLDHPNIIPVHDVGVDEKGAHYFTMKHVKGHTLEDIIRRLDEGDPVTHARFPINVRLQIFLGILSAVHAAHARGVIHRDLKPANIMVGPWDEPVVMDWGLAIRQEELRSTAWEAGRLVGTPLYMSPEQARGDVGAVDPRSDIYALGVVLHEWLTLRHYIRGATSLQEVLDAVATRKPPTALETEHPHQPPLPLDVGYFIEKAMAKDPAARFQSVAEMISGLRDIMQGRCAVQCQVTLVKRGTHEFLRWVDAHPRGTILLSTAAASLLLMNAVSLLLRFF